MNRTYSLVSLALFALMVCGAFAFATSGKASKFDCCYPGSPCCFAGSPCCEGLDCCYPGSPCCFAGSPCCSTGTPSVAVKVGASCCEPEQSCCSANSGCCTSKAVKTEAVSNVQKKSGCCAGR